MKHINKMIGLALGLFLLSAATSTGAFAASPTISNADVQLRTLVTVGIPGGEVGISVSATVEDLDGLDGVRVTVERLGVFGPFPLQRGLYTSPNDICTPGIFIPLKCTLDTYSVTIGPEFIPDAQRAGNYLITVSDGVTTVSTTVTLTAGLTALPAGGQTFVDTSTGLLRPTISIPPIPGASGYRIFIQNDSDSTSTTFDGVAGADLSSTPNIRVGANLLAAGKFYRLRIDAFDGITVASSNVRSESADICYDPATGKTDIPCITQKDVHLITESDGTVVMQAIGRVLDWNDLAYLKKPPSTNPPTVPVTVTRGSFGPFPLTSGILVTIGTESPDSPVTDQFTSSRNPLDASEIPVNQRAGDYNFKAEDSTGNVVTVTRNFPPGLAPFPPAGPLTIDQSSGIFTPTVRITPVPGASNYRVVVFNDTDSTRINFDNLPGGTLAESASVQLFPGVLEPNKSYRIHMDAFNAETFQSSTVRSRSQSKVYDPSDLDRDGDGIQDVIDGQRAGSPLRFVDQSNVPSNNFTNACCVGTNLIEGSIIDRADLNVVVIASPQSDTNQVNFLLLGAAGGSGIASISACALPTVQIQLTDRDTLILKCGSLISEILDGTVEFLLGTQGFVVAPAGARLTIDEPSPGQYTVKNSGESFVPITLVQNGEEITVQPGAPKVSIADFFLHGSGATANPSNLFLNASTPTATPEKSKDSAGIKFNGGNPWTQIGTWTAQPGLSSGRVGALTNLRTWIGLKNSDDQGTRFDLRAEVYKNSTLVASGEVFCLQGVTRNPDQAKEVAVPLKTINEGGFTDDLSLKVLTRIGTNGSGAFCSGHSNAVGLRLYFDAVSRPSKFAAIFSE